MVFDKYVLTETVYSFFFKSASNAPPNSHHKQYLDYLECFTFNKTKKIHKKWFFLAKKNNRGFKFKRCFDRTIVYCEQVNALRRERGQAKGANNRE